MLPQHPTQRRQHVGERGPRLGVPRRALRRKPRLRGRAPGVPRLHERHQDHRQRGLTIHGLAAPAAGVLEAQLLFGFQDRLFHAPAVAGPLGDLGVGRGRVRTEEKVVLLAAGRVADDHQADGHVPAHVIPRARDAQHQALDRAALLQESDAFPPFLAAGGHLAGRGQSPALLGGSPPSARRAAGRRQGIQRRVGANAAHEIRAGRQAFHHVPRGVLAIGGNADFDVRQGLRHLADHTGGQDLPGVKRMPTVAVGRLSVEAEDHRQDPAYQGPARQPERDGPHNPVVRPVNNGALRGLSGGGGVLEPAGVGDVLAAAGGRGVVDGQIDDGLSAHGVDRARFQDHRRDDVDQECPAQGVQRPGRAVEELLVDRPVPVGQTAQGAEDAGDGGRPAMQHPAEGDLPPDLGRRLGEHAAKLEKQGVPRRYQKCRIHVYAQFTGDPPLRPAPRRAGWHAHAAVRVGMHAQATAA